MMELTQGWGQCTMIMLTISWRILAAGGVGDAGRAAGVPERRPLKTHFVFWFELDTKPVWQVI